MSPGGDFFVPSPPEAGTNLGHPPPHSSNDSALILMLTLISVLIVILIY